MSALTSTIACSWSGVSSYGNASSISRCHGVSGPNAKPERRLALAVEDHQLGRDLLHRAADAVAGLLPVGAAHLAERRRVAAGVAADRADLVGRDVELVAAAVRDEEVVALDAADRPGDHPLVPADAVHLVHDEVVGLQVLVVVDGLAGLARAAVDAPAAGEVGLRDEREPGVGQDDARARAARRRATGCRARARVRR